MVPTQNPTNPQCESLHLKLSNFEEFTAPQIASNVTLQHEITNITFYAITESATNFGALPFAVEFHNVSDELCIEHTLCTAAMSNLALLTQIIGDQNDDINDKIENKLTMLYLDGIRSDEMSAKLYATQLRICSVRS